MTWNRTVFVGDSLTNSNNGVISVEIIDSANKINFVVSENALSYNLYGRILGTTNWTFIETIQSGDAMPGGSFFTDDFSWIQSQNIVNIEYKVEVEKNNPQTAEGHYISEFEGSSGEPGDEDEGNEEPGNAIPRTIDRSPFYINYFASFSGFRESYGIAGGLDGGRSDWLHTPAFGNVSALQNPEQNGRLFYVQQQIINKALAGGRMFNRVMIGNPAGFVAGEPLSGSNEDNQGYFTNKAGTCMLVDQVNTYDTRANDSRIGQDMERGLVNTYPTPFTPNGSPGEDRGDQVSSWKVATDAIRAAGVQEVFCYIGYGQAYETPSKDFIDDNLLAFAPGWARSDKEPSVYPADEWQRQWNILSQCGFDNASFDAGTRIARKNNESDYLAGDERIKTIADIVGTDNQIFELIPRDPDGGMKLNGTWDYTKNKGWGLFPVSSGVQVDGEFYGKINTGSQFVIDFTTWDLDPATTEHHAVLDLQSLITAPWVNNSQSGETPNGRLMVFSEFKKLVNTLLSKGLIVSATSWSSSSMVDDINGGTVGPGDLCDYILNPDPEDPESPGERREFVPDHRPFFAQTLSVEK